MATAVIADTVGIPDAVAIVVPAYRDGRAIVAIPVGAAIQDIAGDQVGAVIVVIQDYLVIVGVA